MNRVEIMAFLGIHMFMGIHKLPDMSLYWSNDKALGVSIVKNVMTRDCFDKLSQYLHFNNENAVPRGQPNHDKLYKVQPLLDSIVPKFTEEYQPTQNMVVDEAMVAFKGQLAMKQYMPMKPVKRGIKVWACADSSNGYLCNLQVYTGRQDGGATEQGLGYRVVHDLTRPFINKYHHIFCDNFFASIEIAQDLERDNTYLCGTVRSNIKGQPTDLAKKRSKSEGAKGASLFGRKGFIFGFHLCH
ncbi:hypothetical protein QZH41_008030 [Actinostola sp. cb2023]|nr:hypothetical protein QZH41_008030 [Actinostola sp. cb2023]